MIEHICIYLYHAQKCQNIIIINSCYWCCFLIFSVLYMCVGICIFTLVFIVFVSYCCCLSVIKQTKTKQPITRITNRMCACKIHYKRVCKSVSQIVMQSVFYFFLPFPVDSFNCNGRSKECEEYVFLFLF